MADNRKLDVKRIVREFDKEELNPSSRKASLRIDAPFEEAMKKILKAEPEPKPSKTKKKQKH